MTKQTATAYPVAGLPADVYSVEYVETTADAYYTTTMRDQHLVKPSGEIATYNSFEAAAEALRDYVAWMQL